MMVGLWWLLMLGHRKALAARRRRRTAAYAAWTALAGATWLAASWGMIWLVLLFWAYRLWWASLVIGTLTVGWAALEPLARAVMIPLGRPRAAHWCARRAYHRVDGPASALVAAARAIGRQPAPRPDDIAWLQARCDARGRTGDAEIATAALLASARGDRDTCRLLLDSLGDLGERTVVVRELAAEWLAADDAERGAWPRILDRAAADTDRARGEPLWPASPLTYFLEGVAASTVPGARRPSPIDLIVRWLEAPRRAATCPLLRRALATPAAMAADMPPGAPTDGQTDEAQRAPLPDALAAHAACLRAHARGALDGRALAAAAGAWDRALADADTRLAVLRRSLDVGAATDAGDRVLRAVAREAAADLAEMATTARVSLGDLGASPLLADAAAQLRLRLLGELEATFAALSERCHARQALPALDEWRAFLALTAGYRRAATLAGLELRRLVFPHAHASLNRLAVWLWNERKEYVLSHAVSTWLLAEALAVGDAQAIELHQANVHIGVPAR